MNLESEVRYGPHGPTWMPRLYNSLWPQPFKALYTPIPMSDRVSNHTNR